MKKSDIFPSNYVKASDIGDREVTVVISHTKMEKLGDDNKLVTYFQGKEKGLVTNLTNFDRIAHITGSDDTNDWVGREIMLYSELVTFQGKTTPAIRVKAPPKRQAAPIQRQAPPQFEAEDRGKYDVMERRRTAPVQTTRDDLPVDEEIPF